MLLNMGLYFLNNNLQLLYINLTDIAERKTLAEKLNIS